MEEYYITSDIYINIKNKNMSHLNGVKLNADNWLIYLEDYGYTPLDIEWNLRMEYDGSGFGLLECGANGDCLFHVIAEALNFDKIMHDGAEGSDLYSVESLREIAAMGITEENFEMIIESYKLEYLSFDFNGDWDPHEMETVEDLRNELRKSGDNFWGDQTVLQLLQDTLEFNSIILKSDEPVIYPMASDIDKYDKTIVFYYLSDIHFQLVSYFNGHYLETMYRDGIPEDLLLAYQSDTNNIS
jgi:hypothetical protein